MSTEWVPLFDWKKSPPKKVLIVANPISGRGRGRDAAERVRDELKSQSIESTLVVTEGPEDPEARARLRSMDEDAVFVIGGDGTVNEVIGILSGRRVPVAIIPMGTGNVLAKELGIPRNDAMLSLRALITGRGREIDVARANGRVFAAMVTVGFDAAVAHRVAENRTGPMRMRDYVPAALKTAFKIPHHPMRVSVDGQLIGEDIGYVAVANTSAYGGPICIACDARPDDGLLDIVTVQRPLTLKLPILFLNALGKGASRSRFAGMVRGRTVSIESERSMPVQCDGEAFGETPVLVDLLPKSVIVITPKRFPHK